MLVKILANGKIVEAILGEMPSPGELRAWGFTDEDLLYGCTIFVSPEDVALDEEVHSCKSTCPKEQP